MASIGTAYLDIQPDFSTLNKQIGAQLGGSRFGKLGKAAGVAFGGALAAAGIGKALFDVGKQFDAAYDTIRVGTGATGKTLDGLKRDFKQVVKEVPADFGSASTAIADINTRLGLTGKPLQRISKQFLELSRITGTDVGANVKDVTRAFGDWDVKTRDQSRTLDRFFRASQMSGASVNELAQQVVEFGAPLRQVGFSLDEATALFASFERAGVNTQTMMPGLKFALKTFLKEGLEPGKALRDTFRGIQDGTIGSSEALEIFGQRAGADMVEAIRQGRFELDDMTDAIRNGSDTIMKAGKDTQSFGEKWQLLKNRVLVALEPVAIRVFDAIGTAMDKLPQIVDRVRGAFESLKAMFTGTGGESARLSGLLGNLRSTFDSIRDAVRGAVDIAVVAWDQFGGTITAVAQNALATIGGILQGIAQMLGGLVDFVAGVFTGDWSRAWDGIKAIFGGAWQAMTAAVTGAWNQLKLVVKAGMDAVIRVVKGFGSALGSLGKWLVDQIVSGIKSTASALSGAAGWIKNRVVEFVKGAAGAFVDVGQWVTNRLADGIRTVTAAIGSVGGWIKNRVVEFVKGAAAGYLEAGTWIVNRVVEGFKTITDALGSVGGWLRNRIGDSLKAVGDGFLSIGRTIVNTIVDGMKSGGRALQGFVNTIIGIINKIPGVEIGKISVFAEGGVVGDPRAQVAAFAQGGAVHMDEFARGGHITRPMVVVGEEAPRHPEYVIPTNPAYRGRALGLHARLSKELGIPGYAIGGLIGSLPGTGDLPGWLKGTGSWLLGKAKDFITKKIGSLLGGIFSSSLPDTAEKLERLMRMAKRAQAIHARGFPYVYGGGHSPATYNGPYDCSGAVSAVLRAGDLLRGSGTTDLFKNYGDSGPGKYITIGVRGSTGRNAHMMMKLGNRYFESGSGHGAKWVDGWSGNFPIKRHPPGFRTGGILNDEVLEKLLDPKKVGWGLARGGVVGPFVGAYAQGGVVPRDGLAHVHAGETITPANRETAVVVDLRHRALDQLIDVRVEERDRRAQRRYLSGVR